MKKLDLEVGDLVEVGERRYDVVSDKAGGVALEPVITKTVERLHAERDGRPPSLTSSISTSDICTQTARGRRLG